jgi:hypothetical protein
VHEVSLDRATESKSIEMTLIEVMLRGMVVTNGAMGLW